jgi:hypothetical protein
VLDTQTLHRRASRVLPRQLHTSALMSESDIGERLAEVRFLLRRCPVGAVRFRLAPETVAALAEAPMDYLKEAITAREGLGRRQRPLRYAPWKAIAAWQGQGFVTCTADGCARLWVIVGQQLAVYEWNDRRRNAGWMAESWSSDITLVGGIPPLRTGYRDFVNIR